MVKVGRTTVECPRCHKTRVWRKGHVPSRKNPKQRFVCFDCGTTFYFEKPKKEAKAAVAEEVTADEKS